MFGILKTFKSKKFNEAATLYSHRFVMELKKKKSAPKQKNAVKTNSMNKSLD